VILLRLSLSGNIEVKHDAYKVNSSCFCSAKLAQHKSKTYPELNCGRSLNFSFQLNVSLSERLSKRLSQKVKSHNVFNMQAGRPRSTRDVMQCCTREQELLAQYMNDDDSTSSSPTTAVLSHLGFGLVFFTVLSATLLWFHSRRLSRCSESDSV